MKSLSTHITRCLLAGIVAMLPISGLVLTVGYLETSISAAGLTALPFYFPGLGILMAVVLLYLIGLLLTSIAGRWLWRRVDLLLERVPALGRLYATLKQILGYGEGEDAVFHETVLVPAQGGCGEELGLVTRRIVAPDGGEKWVVFVPGAPNPTSGRLLIVEPGQVKMTGLSPNATFSTLVSIGKNEFAFREQAGGNG